MLLTREFWKLALMVRRDGNMVLEEEPSICLHQQMRWCLCSGTYFVAFPQVTGESLLLLFLYHYNMWGTKLCEGGHISDKEIWRILRK